MNAYVLYVEVEIAPGNEAACREAMLKNARAARETEPGCLQFDVIEDADNPLRVRFYEVYKDEAAFMAHQQTAHFKEWVATGVPLLKSRQRQTFRRIAP
jgi:autoinducer 2-degrading protein